MPVSDDAIGSFRLRRRSKTTTKPLLKSQVGYLGLWLCCVDKHRHAPTHTSCLPERSRATRDHSRTAHSRLHSRDTRSPANCALAIARHFAPVPVWPFFVVVASMLESRPIYGCLVFRCHFGTRVQVIRLQGRKCGERPSSSLGTAQGQWAPGDWPWKPLFHQIWSDNHHYNHLAIIVVIVVSTTTVVVIIIHWLLTGMPNWTWYWLHMMVAWNVSEPQRRNEILSTLRWRANVPNVWATLLKFWVLFVHCSSQVWTNVDVHIGSHRFLCRCCCCHFSEWRESGTR